MAWPATRGDGFALVYSPTGKPFRVNLEKLTGKQVQAWWFDPRTGSFIARERVGDARIVATPIVTPTGTVVAVTDEGRLAAYRVVE